MKKFWRVIDWPGRQLGRVPRWAVAAAVVAGVVAIATTAGPSTHAPEPEPGYAPTVMTVESLMVRGECRQVLAATRLGERVHTAIRGVGGDPAMVPVDLGVGETLKPCELRGPYDIVEVQEDSHAMEVLRWRGDDGSELLWRVNGRGQPYPLVDREAADPVRVEHSGDLQPLLPPMPGLTPAIEYGLVGERCVPFLAAGGALYEVRSPRPGVPVLDRVILPITAEPCLEPHLKMPQGRFLVVPVYGVPAPVLLWDAVTEVRLWQITPGRGGEAKLVAYQRPKKS